MAQSNKPTKQQRHDAQSLLAEMEAMPTMKMQRLGNGMVLGVEKDSVWVYFKVPTGPVADAKDTSQLETAYRPMFTMFNEIAKATPVGAIKKRSVSKSAYRHTHLLRINVPSLWKANDTSAPADRLHAQSRLNSFLYDEYPPKIINDSILCFGVKLEAKTSGSGLRQAWDSILFTLVEGGTPLVDYLSDLDKVKAMAARAGLTSLSDKEIRKLDSWWNSGKNPDVVTLTHPDHMHLFSDHRSVRAAQNAGPAECEDWSDDMPGHRIISFGSLEDLEVEFEDAYHPAANWLLPALQTGALAISIRGQVEPQKLTREAIRTNRRQYLSDIQERQQQGKLSRAEEQDRFQELTAVEGEYGAGGGTPTLMNASVLAAFDGQIEDFEVIDRGLASWLPMEFRQDKAWAEMMIASVRRANPNLLDMPVQNVAASGINSVSKVGDKFGILLGFTENDHVPSRHSLESAYGLADRSPVSVCVASSGSGKTMLLQWEAFQTAMLGYDQICLDFKPGSDLTPVFGAIPGAQTFSLDELAKADGAFDALTYSETPEIGIPFAVDAIRKSDPYSHPDKSGEMEPDLAHALTWAVSNGATATLQALRMANDEGEFPDDHMKAIERLAGSYPAFRALCGSGESGNALGRHKGTTLIKVGSGGLKLPTPGNPPQSQMERINITLVKNVIFAATAALNHRKGVLRVDEAWVLTANDPEGLDQLARLARSQTIDITLYTQKISDALDIGLGNYISRGVIMHIAEEAEAIAACQLMDIEPTPERLQRITATGMLDDDNNTPDANSLKPLKITDPATGKERVIRGAVAYYMDIGGRVVPVELDVPPRFVKIASTNIDDVRARDNETANA